MAYIPYTTQAVIGYDNVFAAGTLIQSTDTAGGEARNAIDGFTFDYWRPNPILPGPHTLRVVLGGAASCDYLAIHAHNLASVGSAITLQGSSDGQVWTTVAGPFSPATNGPQLWRFPPQSFAQWRVSITGTGVALGVVQAGMLLVLPEGVYGGEEPATLNRKPKILNAESEGGQLLGRSRIRQGAGTTIRQERVLASWVRSTWAPFARHAETRPFFYAWRSGAYPGEVIYGWSTKPATAKQGTAQYMSVGIDVEGQVE